MYLTAVLIAITTWVFVIFYRKRRKYISLFKELGIPGPTPSFILGNASQLQPLGPANTLQMWTQKYGEFYGYYEGVTTPVLVTTDLDFLQHVFVKDFSIFAARKSFPLNDETSEENVNMFVAEGYRWKRLRSIVSPVFTTSKLKSMTPLMTGCVSTMMERMDAKHREDKPFNILEVFQGLTMEVISSTAFGIEVSQRNHDEPFLVACRRMFRNMEYKNMPFIFKALILTAAAFPEICCCLRWIFLSSFSPLRRLVIKDDTYLRDQFLALIADRKENPINRPDFIQMMLTAETESIDLTKEGELYSEGVSTDEMKTNSYIMGVGSSSETFTKHLTLNEMEANSRLFLIAGFETTSNALGYAAYELAFRPDIQEKMQEEMDEVLGAEGTLDYTSLQKLRYLDMVFNEILRLHPIAPSVITRRCLKDTLITGKLVKKGMVVAADVLTIHNDPNIWGPDPDKFDPERFDPELHSKRHPMSFLSFGVGPRNCIGMRFALLEGKLALATLINKYTVVKCADTPVPLRKTEGVTIAPTGGTIPVKLRLRDYKTK
ncbi:cytochrome P450 3A8-like [Tubulanus polymorphus]|uniref:cytochrome P450 3A8-like n=1 Tax=Tubulanus polymorphus TaxID=672921 RepID=UPI003DA443B9